MFELPWQTHYRTSGSLWIESPVLFQPDISQSSVPTYPWPGKETWTGQSFGTVAPDPNNMVDIISMIGKPQPRQDNSGKAPVMTTFENGYFVDPLT
jgi:hypothetical protein